MKNLHWLDLQPTDVVSLRGSAYYALRDGETLALYWTGHDAAKAQRALDSRVRETEGKRR